MTHPIAEYRVAGDGHRTLVFLHGLGGDYNNWEPQMAALSADYRCLAWTLPGYGESPGIERLTWPDLANAVAHVLDDAEVETATIVGLSMGGYIAQQFGADHPSRVDKLVLAATTSQFGRGSASFAEKFLASRLAPLDQGQTPSSLAPTIAAGLLSAGAPPGAAENCITSMSRITPEAYRSALSCLVTWNFVDRLGEIVAPTLCIAGSEDRTAPVAAVQALADGLPHADFTVIEDCNHLINLDRPKAFNDLVRDFVDEEAER